MDKKLKHWKGIKKAELRSIPVICGACGQQVSIGGNIEDNKIIWDNCPNCKAAIEGYLTMATDEVPEQKAPPLSAEVMWCIEGGRIPECKMVIGKTASVSDVLLSVIATGANFYAHATLPQSTIYLLLANFLANNMIMLKDLPQLIKIINARLSAQPQISGQTDLYTGGNGGHSEPLSILNINKEDDNNDG